MKISEKQPILGKPKTIIAICSWLGRFWSSFLAGGPRASGLRTQGSRALEPWIPGLQGLAPLKILGYQ